MGRSNSKTLAAAAIVMAAAPGFVLADAPSAAAPVAPSLTDVLTSSGITLNGYVAASYYRSSGYNSFHEFDVKHDTFQVDQAGLTVAYQPKSGFGALVDILAGEDATVMNSSENNAPSSNRFDARQAYLQYAAGPLTVIAGKFTTLAGYEYSNPVSNTNFSRSFLYFAEPLTHTGLRATWAATGTLSLTAGVNNGWNYTSINSGSKTAELAAAFNPTKAIALNLNGYFGKDPNFDAERDFVDFVGSYNVTSALTVAVNYDWGKQEQRSGPDLDWDGVAAYANYAINGAWRVSVRAEFFHDKDGFVTGASQKLKEGTVTFGYSPVKNFELRLEGRYDKSDQPTFLRSVNPTNTFDDNQTEVAIQGLYKFGY